MDLLVDPNRIPTKPVIKRGGLYYKGDFFSRLKGVLFDWCVVKLAFVVFAVVIGSLLGVFILGMAYTVLEVWEMLM